MRNILFTATFAVASTVLSSTASAENVTLRLSNWLPPTHLVTTEILEPWATQVEDVTDGRVSIEFIPALGSPAGHYDLVRNGVADIAFSVDGYTADRFKLPYAVRLPFLAKDSTTASVAYWRTYKEHLEQHNEFGNVKVLGLWTFGPGNIHTTDREIASLDDFRGLRIRVSSDIVQDIVETLGGSPMFAPASEVYELISRGVVDGASFNYDSIVSFRIDDSLNHVLDIPGGLYRESHYVIMNQARWEALHPQDKEAIMEVSGEALSILAGNAWDRNDILAKEKLLENGYTIIEPSEEFLQEIGERLTSITEAWKKRVANMGVDGQVIIDSFKKNVEKAEKESFSASPES